MSQKLFIRQTLAWMVHVATKVEARTKQRKHYNKSKQRVQCEKRKSERASERVTSATNEWKWNAIAIGAYV